MRVRATMAENAGILKRKSKGNRGHFFRAIFFEYISEKISPTEVGLKVGDCGPGHRSVVS